MRSGTHLNRSKWSWLQRQMAINNFTFKDEQEIGQEGSKWMNIYNKNYSRDHKCLQEHLVVCVHRC